MAQLLKVHGSMNQFFILDQDELDHALSTAELVKLAPVLCDPHQGPLGGADGLLVVDVGTHDGVRGRMQVINADGSIASMCGNGLRTVSRYLSEKYGEDHFIVQTQNADLQVRKEEPLAPVSRLLPSKSPRSALQQRRCLTLTWDTSGSSIPQSLN